MKSRKKSRLGYWLKDKLNNCSIRERCPECGYLIECLGEYVDRSYEGTL